MNKRTMRERFPLESEQLELLLAFETHPGLQALAKAMSKDPSVVSRNLQRLAELQPVIVKENGRWQLTQYGRETNALTRNYISSVTNLITAHQALIKNSSNANAFVSAHAALVLVNAQNVWLGATENAAGVNAVIKNLEKLLHKWRSDGRPVFHVKHVSGDNKSPFHESHQSSGFVSELQPKRGENVISKERSSAFAGTGLADLLEEKKSDTVVVAGFTARDCIDATARQAGDLGFRTIVVSDSSASFDFHGPDGELFQAERIHKLVMANLHALYAEVVTTNEILSLLGT